MFLPCFNNSFCVNTFSTLLKVVFLYTKQDFMKMNLRDTFKLIKIDLNRLKYKNDILKVHLQSSLYSTFNPHNGDEREGSQISEHGQVTW